MKRIRKEQTLEEIAIALLAKIKEMKARRLKNDAITKKGPGAPD